MYQPPKNEVSEEVKFKLKYFQAFACNIKKAIIYDADVSIRGKRKDVVVALTGNDARTLLMQPPAENNSDADISIMLYECSKNAAEISTRYMDIINCFFPGSRITKRPGLIRTSFQEQPIDIQFCKEDAVLTSQAVLKHDCLITDKIFVKLTGAPFPSYINFQNFWRTSIYIKNVGRLECVGPGNMDDFEAVKAGKILPVKDADLTKSYIEYVRLLRKLICYDGVPLGFCWKEAALPCPSNLLMNIRQQGPAGFFQFVAELGKIFTASKFLVLEVFSILENKGYLQDLFPELAAEKEKNSPLFAFITNQLIKLQNTSFVETKVLSLCLLPAMFAMLRANIVLLQQCMQENSDNYYRRIGNFKSKLQDMIIQNIVQPLYSFAVTETDNFPHIMSVSRELGRLLLDFCGNEKASYLANDIEWQKVFAFIRQIAINEAQSSIVNRGMWRERKPIAIVEPASTRQVVLVESAMQKSEGLLAQEVVAVKASC